MTDIVERLNDSLSAGYDNLSAGYSELRKEAAVEIMRLRAKIKAMEQQEPDAWRTFNGECGYDYRSYEDNENYQFVWNVRNPKHEDWVKPLYLAPGAQPTSGNPEGWKLVPIEPKLHVGNLPTINQDGYPALGAWWVQLWDGDDVFARVYGSSPEEAHNRAEMLATAPEAKP